MNKYSKYLIGVILCAFINSGNVFAKTPAEVNALIVEILKGNKTTETIDKYTDIIKKNPEDLEALKIRGVLYTALEQYENAIADLEKVYKNDAKDEMVKVALGEAYCEYGFTFRWTGKYDKAIEILNKSIEVNPNYYRPWFYRGRTNNLNGDQIKAMADYSKSIELDPKFPFAYNNRGAGYVENKEYAKAMKDFNKALEIDSTGECAIMAYKNRGDLYAKQGDKDSALRDYNKCLKLDPKKGDALYRRGGIFYERRDLKKAIQDYSEYIKIYPKSGDAYYMRGLSYDLMKDYEKAISDFGKAIEFNPKDKIALFHRAYTGGKIRDYEQVIEDYNKMVEVGGVDKYVYNNRGIAYLEKGNYDLALEDFESAIELGLTLYPECGKGQIYFMQGNLDLALEQFDKSLKIAKNMESFLGKVMVYNDKKKKGDILGIADKVKEYLEQEIASDKNKSSNYSELAELYCEVGIRLDNAMEMAQKAVELDADPYNYYVLGLCWYKKGDLKKAIENLEKSKSLKRMSTRELYRLGSIYKEAGNTAKAKEVWQEGLKINPVHRFIKTEMEKVK